MKHNRKAQLSIETMIIYGLVILVALSVIGGLLYFNILDIGSYLPDKCDVGGAADLKCEEMRLSSGPDDKVASDDVFQLGIRNIGQRPITEVSVVVSDESSLHFSDSVTGTVEGGTIAPGEIKTVDFDLSSIEDPGVREGSVLRGTIITTYLFSDGAVTQEASGTIRVRAS